MKFNTQEKVWLIGLAIFAFININFLIEHISTGSIGHITIDVMFILLNTYWAYDVIHNRCLSKEEDDENY